MYKHTAVFSGAMLFVALSVFAQDGATESGITLAYVSLDRITQVSAEGKIATARIQALAQQKNNEIGERQKQLQASQQKLQAGGTVLSAAAQLQLEREIERLGLDIQRMQEDAQVDVTELQAELQAQFEEKLMPIINEVVKERGIDFLFSRVEAGIVFANPALDLSDEIIRRFDASVAAPAASSPSGSQPAAPPGDTPQGP